MSPKSPSSLLRPLALGALGILLAAGVAACGSSSDASTGPGASASNNDNRVKFASCMRKHGVNVPDPGANGQPPGTFRIQGGDRTKMNAAMQACRKYLQGAFRDISPEQRKEFQDAMLAFTACLREHGLDVKDPQFGANGPQGGGGFLRFDRNDPATQKAMQACQSKMPRPPGGGVRGGPPGGGSGS